jgi:hypothetical protein
MQVYTKMWDFMSARPHVFVTTYDEGIKRVREKKGDYSHTSEQVLGFGDLSNLNEWHFDPFVNETFV